MTELEVLLEQLEELLGAGVDDADEALEVAEVAGLVARLDPTAAALEDAVAWRDGEGAPLLEEAWDDFDPWELFGEIERAVEDDADADVLEEVLSDLDDAVAAAVWCGRAGDVAEVIAKVTELVSAQRKVFARVADLGAQLLDVPGVMGDPEIYTWWAAIAPAPGGEGSVGGA